MLALAVVAFVLPSSGFSLFAGGEAWRVGIWVAGQAALVLSVAASALALMPRRIIERDMDELLSWAMMLLWAGLALNAVNLSLAAVDSIGTPSPFE